jgi:hypothetical protein
MGYALLETETIKTITVTVRTITATVNATIHKNQKPSRWAVRSIFSA